MSDIEMNRSENGFAVVLVLMVMALLTAMVVEFVAETYTANAALSNWSRIQRLSLAARSGIALLEKTLSDRYDRYSYTYPGTVETPVADILEHFQGTLVIKVEDENAKFNLNSLVQPNGTLNQKAYEAFMRLLKHLGLDERIADRVADWIDPDQEPRQGGMEAEAKNAYMDSVDELRLIIDAESSAKLLPFVTVYGVGDVYAAYININTAPLPVLMALDDAVTLSLAQRIESYRSVEPFKNISDIVKVAGFEGPLGQSLIGRIIVKASNLRITSTASEDRIRRVIECVVAMNGERAIVKYWQET